RDEPAARPDRAGARRGPAAAAHDGSRVRRAVQGGARGGPEPDLRAGEGGRGSRRLVGDALVPVATLLGVLVMWEAAARAFRIPAFVVPLPSAVLREGWAWRYRFIEHTWVTLYETLGGFALSVAVGVPLAVLIIYSAPMRRALYPLIVLAQSVPKIAIAPVLLLITGHGEFPKII